MITDGGILYSQIDSQLPEFVSTEHTKFAKFIEKYYEFLELNLITFTDLDLNEDAILQEKANTTYTITVATGNNTYSNSANKFYVDGAVSPTITLIPGAHAIFDQGDETNAGHYFYISKTPNGIHTAGGVQFTTDDREDVLFTSEGTPGAYDNITLEDATIDDYGITICVITSSNSYSICDICRFLDYGIAVKIYICKGNEIQLKKLIVFLYELSKFRMFS